MQFIQFVTFVASSTVAIYNLCKVIGETLRERDKQRASNKTDKQSYVAPTLPKATEGVSATI